ncbi:MAG TPA: O-antigen ligase family protein [Bacteroidales bacterium]|nr:O-antigen ligase family protein [Bacteroidales bacterium]
MNYSAGREPLHRTVYLFGLALLVSCLPLSRYLLSIAQFTIVINWIAEGNFKRKFSILHKNPAILLFASVFIVYAVGLLYSEDLKTGFEKIINTLPLLILPLVIGTSKPLSTKASRRLLILFTIAVSAASMVCFIRYAGYGLPPGADFREISVFMSHIRFALLIDMAIAISIYYAIRKHGDEPLSVLRSPWFFIILSVFLTAFLFFLRSATGIVIFFIILGVFGVNRAFHSKSRFIRYSILGATTAFSLTAVLTVYFTWNRNFSPKPFNPTRLKDKTANGNLYTHDIEAGILENGNYTWLYICEPELEREWNRLSPIHYDEFDHRHQAIRTTIIRYLTSKNLTKDSAGIHHLSQADLSNIEKGLANYRFSEHPGIRQRLYETLYEIHIIRKSGFAESHSLGQRLLFYKAALPAIKESFWFGYGTGDAYNIMANQARSENLAIDSAWKGKPHNQFLFFLLAFGITGFLWIVFSWVYTVIFSKAYTQLLFNQMLLITGISMMVIDTLESYDNIVFFSFFFCLFAFNYGDITSYNEKMI